MRKILTAIVALVSLISSVPIVMPTTSPVTANVQVQTWCDISATSPINFGTKIPGEISSDVTSTVSMPIGNQVVTPTIEGTDWTPTTTFDVSQTHWYNSDVLYASMTPLTTGPVSIGDTIGPGDDAIVHFKLQVPNGQVVGNYSQTITITAC
jgi:spore coat protein U-like protein